MDLAHLHLLFNHLPIFGSIIGALVLTQGIFTKSDSTTRAAFGIFVLSAAGAAIAYYTGEPAEEKLEGVRDVSKAAISSHESAAAYALTSLIILGISAIWGYYLSLRKSPFLKKASFIILIISLVSFALVARTGYLGGQIRHPDNTKAASTKGIEADSLKNEGEAKEHDD